MDGRNNIRLSDVRGLDNVKGIVQSQLLSPLKYQKTHVKLGLPHFSFFLLCGASGTGKSMFVNALVNEMGMRVRRVLPCELASPYVGGICVNIERIFSEAKTRATDILFFDQPCDRLFKEKCDLRVLNQFELGLDNLAKVPVVVFLETYRPYEIDPAILAKAEVLYFGLPELSARLDIIKAELAECPCVGNVDICTLAAATEGFSGATLCQSVFEAKSAAACRYFELVQAKGQSADDVTVAITASDLKQGILKLTPEIQWVREQDERIRNFIGEGMGDDE